MRNGSFFVLALFSSVIVFAVLFSSIVFELDDSTPIEVAPDKQLPKLKLFEKVTDFSSKDRDFRVVFIGDVHGQYNDLQALVNHELGGLDEKTTIVLLGDMVSKGPDSDKVVSFILNNKDRVKCIMGNHDLAVLFAYMNPMLNRYPLRQVRRKLNALEVDSEDEYYFPDDITKVKLMHTEIAETIGFEKLRDLTLHCPVAMEIPLPDSQTLFTVHAGIMPGDFVNRIPHVGTLTEMKYVNPKDWSDYSREKDHRHKKRWFKFWRDGELKNKYKHYTVFYGHDASMGLNLHKHTKGMDSGCVKGESLSGFVYEYYHKEDKITHHIVQTDCQSAYE